MRAIVTHRGPTTDGGGARNSNTPGTYGRRGGGGVRAIVTTVDVRPTGGGEIGQSA